jgi:hypothetical protein
MSHRPLAARFQAKVDRRGPDECWPWLGSTNRGYGLISDGHRQMRSTHVALDLDGRPVPKGMSAMHTCDNPPCVNPVHLLVATHLENMRDMFAKGRGVPIAAPPLREFCVRGHSMADAIPERPPRRGRLCVSCRDIRNRARPPKRAVAS